MIFFQCTDQVLRTGIDLTLTIRKNGNELIVSVLPKVRDKETPLDLNPVVLTGKPAELDESFFDHLAKAAAKVEGVVADLTGFEKKLRAEQSSAQKKIEKKVEKAPAKPEPQQKELFNGCDG